MKGELFGFFFFFEDAVIELTVTAGTSKGKVRIIGYPL